jgi:hypothetical protein
MVSLTMRSLIYNIKSPVYIFHLNKYINITLVQRIRRDHASNDRGNPKGET